jgi:hypothetical protein
MAQKTEKLPQETLDLLVKSQNKANELIFTLGQIHLRIKELNNQISIIEEDKIELENQIDNASKEFTTIIRDLEVKYPKGEVDLNQGIVIYESAE